MEELNRQVVIKRTFESIQKALGLSNGWLNSRYREYVDIRACAYHYLRNEKKYTLSEIGRAIDKNHATIISALRNYDQLIHYPEFREVEIKVLRAIGGENIPPSYEELIEMIANLEARINELESSTSSKKKK